MMQQYQMFPNAQTTVSLLFISKYEKKLRNTAVDPREQQHKTTSLLHPSTLHQHYLEHWYQSRYYFISLADALVLLAPVSDIQEIYHRA